MRDSNIFWEKKKKKRKKHLIWMDHAMFPSLSLYIAVLQSRAAQFPAKGNNRPSLRLSPAESILYMHLDIGYIHTRNTHTRHTVCVCLYLFEWILLLGIVSSCLMSFYFFFFFSCWSPSGELITHLLSSWPDGDGAGLPSSSPPFPARQK